MSQLLFLGDSPAFERFVDRSQSRTVVTAYLRSDDSALVGPLVRHLEAWVAAHPAPDGEHVLIAGGAGPTVLAVNEHTTYGKLLNMLVVLAVIYARVVAHHAVARPSGLYVVTPIVVTMIVLFGGARLDRHPARHGLGVDHRHGGRRRRRLRHLLPLPAARGAPAAGRRRRGRRRGAPDLGPRRSSSWPRASRRGSPAWRWSPYLGMQLFGTLMPAAMLVSCLAALTLMPVLVLRLRPRFIFGDEPPPRRRSASRRAEPAHCRFDAVRD